MRTALLFAVAALPMFGQGLPMGPVFNSGGSSPCTGYTAQGSVVIPAASGSTQTNFTVAFKGTNSKFKTLANGGLVQNTVTRVGQTVPADLIVSLDAACASGVTWGWDFYDPTTGDVKIWAMIPSYSSSGATTLYVSVGNASVTTYQGGAQGAEFDTSTMAVYHYPNGSSLSAKDFSSFGLDGTTAGTPTACAGQIDGCTQLTSASSQSISSGNVWALQTAMTVSAWINTSFTGNYQGVFSKWGDNGADENFIFATCITTGAVAAGVNTTATSYFSCGTTNVSNGAWHHIAMTWSTGSNSRKIYVDGALDNTLGTSGSSLVGTGSVYAGRLTDTPYFFTGKIDEIKYAAACPFDCGASTSGTTAERSADWIATEYANQLSPPVIAAF